MSVSRYASRRRPRVPRDEEEVRYLTRRHRSSIFNQITSNRCVHVSELIHAAALVSLYRTVPRYAEFIEIAQDELNSRESNSATTAGVLEGDSGSSRVAEDEGPVSESENGDMLHNIRNISVLNLTGSRQADK